MNTKYLFRGKRVDNGEWIEGQRCTNGREVWIVYDEDFSKETVYGEDKLNAFRFFEVDPSTVGQCTGLRDRTGKLIFEGDILNDTRTADATAIVTWLEGGCYVKNTLTCSVKSFRDIDICLDSLEIIGNIHDTPEILEEV